MLGRISLFVFGRWTGIRLAVFELPGICFRREGRGNGVWWNPWARKGVDIEKKSSVEIEEFCFVWPLSIFNRLMLRRGSKASPILT